MPKPRLYSIKELTDKDCYQTGGSRPVRVLCNDFDFYICKYSQGHGPAFSLFNEFIAGCFLEIWRLPVPEFGIVQVNPEHVRNIGMPFHYFEMPCFGSKFNHQLGEVEQFFHRYPFSRKNIESFQRSFLKIALFDIWLANEDRNNNNMNLLINTVASVFVPIDHGMIFNGQNIDKQPYQLNEGDSILTSLLGERLISRPLQQSLSELRSSIETEFDRDIAACHESLEQLLSNLPTEWHIDHDFVRSRLEMFFSKTWINDCITTYNTCLQMASRR